jgi:hypothetical protein
MTARPSLTNVEYAEAVLERCARDGLSRITLATDSAELNIETFLLAKELLGPSGQAFTISTLAYEVVYKRTLEESYQTILESDAVVFESPAPRIPDFTNSRGSEYAAFTEQHAVGLDGAPGSRLTLYRISR